jgi:hypothetical protein
MRRLSLLLCILPLLLLAACSDDDSDTDPAASPTAVAAATSEAPATTGDAGAVTGTVSVDFTGAPQEMEPVQAPFEVEQGSTAWDAVRQALGEDNVSFEDFGGDLGIFISGFNGVEAEGNHFWEFRVNGEGAQSGVSKYEVQQGDMLEFVYSSF